MNLNATLFGQMITFAILVWFTAKFIWPPMIKAMRDRQAKIAHGLQSAERGERHLAAAREEGAKIVAQHKLDAAQLVERAQIRAHQIVEEAKEIAVAENRQILEEGRIVISREMALAREELCQALGELIMMTSEQVLKSEIDAAQHHQYLLQSIETWRAVEG